MAGIEERQVLAALAKVVDPDLHRDIVSLNFVKQVAIDGGRVKAVVELTTPACPAKERMKQQATDAVAAIPGVESVEIVMTAQVRAAPKRQENPVAGVKNVIAVASGKGGVGKSTTAVNLALALAAQGASVGLLDADIYGPSLPRLLGVEGRPQSRAEASARKMPPLEIHGIKAMSIGFLLAEDAPMVWRGPMVAMAVEQLLRDVAWGTLDYLIVDMPPGTGDAQLTLTQKVPLAGAVIVSTPQDVALADVKRGIAMFRKVNVPVLGIVENMSYYICPDCGHRAEIFSHGGARQEAERSGIAFLGEIPLDEQIRLDADSGLPIVVGRPDSEQARKYMELASAVAARVATIQMEAERFPSIVVEE